MSKKKLDNRVDELERRSSKDMIYAVWYSDEPELCRVVHTGELLSVEDFMLKYHGTLIKVNYVPMEPEPPLLTNL